MEPQTGSDKPHLPPPTLWPVGFAIGIACLLVGLVVSWVAVGIGAAIAAFFGFLWVRDLSKGVREAPEPPVVTAATAPAAAEPATGERFPRSRFLEGATLGLGAVIGGAIAVPPVGLTVASSFFHHEFREIDLGALSDFPAGKFVITTFVSDPEAGEVSRRTAYIRSNGLLRGQPSFTIVSNRCVHLGCPVQPNGPVDQRSKVVRDKQGIEVLKKTGVRPAGFGCPCHGGAYDNEGNATAGPPVRALDRYQYSIKNGRLVLGAPYSVASVQGEGKDALIKRYRLHSPGQPVDGPEAWLWPIPEIR